MAGVGRAHPVGGVDYPRTFRQLLAWFPDDTACLDYLAGLRWPDGFVCPVCASSRYWRTAKARWMCVECGRQTSVTSGTIFHRTRTPLSTWFAAVWFITSQKNGVSALGLQRVLGFGSYETAWVWLLKLRRAMVRPDRDKLVGSVEVDETYIGGKEIGKGKQGRGAETKTLVVVAAECKGKQIGRVRFSCISDASGENLLRFIEDNIEPGSTIITDGWRGYSSLSQSKKYKHESKIISGSGQEAHELMEHIREMFRQNICPIILMNLPFGSIGNFRPTGGSCFIG